MSKGVLAKRYAVALFQLAKEQNTLEQFVQELSVIKQVFTENNGLQAVLSNPKISLEKKKAIIFEAFSAFSESIVNALYLLLEGHRENIISDVASQFIELSNDAKGIAEATVYSARALTNAEKLNLSSVFAQKIGKSSLKITNIIDQSLIGGVKIRIGNRIYDGSVSGKLQRLERSLLVKDL